MFPRKASAESGHSWEHEADCLSASAKAKLCDKILSCKFKGLPPSCSLGLLAGVGAHWGAMMGASDPALEMLQPARSSVQAALSPDNITRSNHSETMYCSQEVE